MKRLTMALLLAISSIPFAAVAAEVKNLKVGQSGDKAVATYDLAGQGGEKEAKVTVAITIGSERRTADKLRLTGDFGKGVKVGPGKRIVWNATADLLPNFDGDLSWDVTVVDSSHHAGTDARLEAITDEMVIPSKFGDVRFNHRLHAEILRDCRGCHENGPGRIDNFGKEFAHMSCKGCHSSMKTGPIKCRECHKK